MAKKKAKGISGLDRQIAAKRKALAAIRKKESEKKRAAKKVRTLRALESKLKTAKKRK